MNLVWKNKTQIKLTTFLKNLAYTQKLTKNKNMVNFVIFEMLSKDILLKWLCGPKREGIKLTILIAV